MTIHPQTLSLFPETFAICRLKPGAALPLWAQTDPFFSITSTPDELSLVTRDQSIPADVQTRWPVLASQTRTAGSSPAEARYLPSGDRVRTFTRNADPWEVYKRVGSRVG